MCIRDSAKTARLVVVHTNFIKGEVAKTNAMRGLGFWSLADGGERRDWPDMCVAAAAKRGARANASGAARSGGAPANAPAKKKAAKKKPHRLRRA